VGALAGMSLGNAAHAQVIPGGASSAFISGAPAIAPRQQPAPSAKADWPNVTRFYIQNAAVDVDPASVRGAWDVATYGAYKLSRSKSGSIAQVSKAETVDTTYNALLLKLVSEPLTADVNFGGTLNWVLGARESGTAMNAHWHVHAYVLRGTNTLVTTLLNNFTEAAGVNEWPTTAAGKGPNGGTAVAINSAASALAGDRIVIEVGYVARNSDNQSFSGSLWVGGTAGDLTVGGNQATLTGWFEFSDNLFPPTLTISKPTGTAVNDVLIASIGTRPNGYNNAAAGSTVIAPPDAGWTLVDRVNNTSGTVHSLAVYRKVVTDVNEPASYDWKIAGYHSAVGGIQAFTGVDNVTPIAAAEHAGASDTNTGNTTHSTPSITTALANSMIVTSFMKANCNSATWSTPSGMTEAFDAWNSCGGSDLAADYALQAGTGATGAKQASSSPGNSASSHILALRAQAPSSTLTINKPAGLAQNDVMIASITVGPSTATIAPPAGWALVRRMDNPNDTSNSLAVYSKLAGGSEPASYDWTISAGHAGAAGGIQAFSGADLAIEVENGQNTGASTSHATPSVTTGLANTMLVTSHGVGAASNSWTPPSGMTEGVEAQGGTQGLVMSYALQPGAGASGAKSATSSASGSGNAHILAVRRVIGSFNAFETSTGANAISGVIKTKIAGTTVTTAIAALNAAKGAVATTFVGTVKIEVLDASDNSAALDANGCRSTWPVIQALSDLTFVPADNGRKNTSFTVANTYPNVRLRMGSPAGAPAIIGCSSDNFAIRPNQFINVLVTDNDAQTAGTTRTLNNLAAPGGTVHKAGQPFTVRATAVNGAGTPVTTTNYAGTATTTLADCGATNACLASGFGTLTVGAGFVAGQLTSNLATYSEVGSVAVTLVDSTFANVDAGDGSTAAEREIKSSSAVNVGRFVPDHFAVALNTPSFGTACGAGSFTYVGQGFNYSTAPVITVTAQNAANATTLSYSGALWQITAASLTGKSYTAASGTFDTTGITGTDPAIVDSGSGVGTLTFRSPSFFGAGTGFFFTRTTPVAPFNADVSLAINVIDADGVAYATNPARFGQATAGNGIAFSAGNSMRFGRLAMRNANGSHLVPLPVPVETQYWGYTNPPLNTVLGFITNTADSCTSFANNNVQMSGFTANLVACETAVNGAGTLSGGREMLLLPAPGNANNGSVQLTVNLGASNSGTTCTSVGGGTVPAAGASRAYLQGNWTGSAYDQNPKARAAFGVFRGADEVIFIRENF
jgi:MSHA biogenesis protein MshQ